MGVLAQRLFASNQLQPCCAATPTVVRCLTMLVRIQGTARQYTTATDLPSPATHQPASVAGTQSAGATSSSCPQLGVPDEAAAHHTPQRMLMRDFIQNSLYHPTRGYFNRAYPVVGNLSTPIDFWKIATKAEWLQVMAKTYKQLGTAWLTPVETFSPWYGHILARHIVEHRKHNLQQERQPLDIIEVGGGNGTLAKDILDWLRKQKPELYSNTTYTCYEISSRLAGQQFKTVVQQAGHVDRFKVVQGNAWSDRTWGSKPNYRHCVILVMEVLDNLPHDKVRRSHPKEFWQQSMVQLADSTASSAPRQQQPHRFEDGPWEEVWQPANDPLLMRTLRAVYQPPTMEQKLDHKLNKFLDYLLHQDPEPDLPKGELIYVPTASLALLDIIHRMRPNHSLILADFDKLPQAKLPGRNAPLVSEKLGGENKDHDTLFVPWGTADILFPTDFDGLAKLYTASAQHVYGGEDPGKLAYAHYQQGAVMKRYPEMEKTATLLSFNPMVNDFLNMRFFMADAYGRTAQQVQAHQAVLKAMEAAWSEQPEPLAPSSTWGALIPQPALAAAQAKADQQAGTQQHSPGSEAGPTTSLQPIDFSWQYGYGKGMQHAAMKRGRRVAGAVQPTAPKTHGHPKPQAAAAGAQQQTAWRVGSLQQGEQQEGPVLGGRHLRQKKGKQTSHAATQADEQSAAAAAAVTTAATQ